MFDVHCSKGTYIRTLCADLGEALGCGGHMSFLLRKRAGSFDSENALTIEEIEKLAAGGELESYLDCVDKAFDKYKSIRLDRQTLRKLLNGISVDVKDTDEIKGADLLDNELVRVYNVTGNFVALGELSQIQSGLRLKAKKQFDQTAD